MGENDQGVYGSRLHVTNLVVEKQSGQRLPKSVLKKEERKENASVCVCVCVYLCVHGRESGKGTCRIFLQETGRSKYIFLPVYHTRHINTIRCNVYRMNVLTT